MMECVGHVFAQSPLSQSQVTLPRLTGTDVMVAAVEGEAMEHGKSYKNQPQ